MELVQILQLCFMFGIFLLNLLFVILPLRLIPPDQGQDQQSTGNRGTTTSSRRIQRILDLFNSFSGGVFLGTCFIHLVPQAESTMDAAFLAGGMPLTYSSALTQLASMLGFFAILLVDRCVESCRGTRSARTTTNVNRCATVDEHELTSVKGYIVTVSSSESTLSDDESDVELVRERDSMLRNKSSGSDNSADAASKITNRPAKSTKTKRHDMSARSRASASAGSMSTASRCHAHLVAPAELDDFSLRCVILLVALSLHSLFEGVAVGLQHTVMALTGLAVGITVHGCLVAFAFGVTLAMRHQSVHSSAIKYGFIYSMMVPVGVGIGMAVGSIGMFIGRLVSALLQSLTAGTFIYVIFMEILPSEMDTHCNRLLKVFVMFVGFVIICSLRFIVVMIH